MKLKKISAFIIAAAGLLAATAARAQNINTYPSWNGTSPFYDWGTAPENTTVFGSLFTPAGGQSASRSITFAIQNPTGDTIPFQAFVYRWTGSGVTGPALFQSAVSSDPSNGNTFDNIKVSLASTGNGSLHPGQQYVVFFSTLGFSTPSGEGAGFGYFDDLKSTAVYANIEGGGGVTLQNWDGTDTDATFAYMLIFGPPSFAPFALTPNQLSVALALDHAVATNNPGIQPLVNYLGNLPTGFLPQAFDLISGEEYTSIFDEDYSTAHQDDLNIINHLAELQASEPGYGTGLVALAIGSDGKTVVDGKDGKGGPAPAPENRWSFFANANGGFTQIGGDTNANGFSYASEGITLGLDYKVRQDLAVGAYLGYNHTFTSLVNNGAFDSNGVTGGLYGTWFSHGFYVNGIVGGGYSGFDSRRFGLGGVVRGSSDSPLFNALGGTGYDMHHGNWTFGPTASLEYTQAWIDSFTEAGSAAPLSVPSQNETSLRSFVGAHISYTAHVNGLTVRPDLHASWLHEYDDAASSFSAQIANTNAAFTVQGPNLGHDAALVGTGLTVDLSDRSSVYANYEGQFGRMNLNQNIASVGFRLDF